MCLLSNIFSNQFHNHQYNTSTHSITITMAAFPLDDLIDAVDEEVLQEEEVDEDTEDTVKKG